MISTTKLIAGFTAPALQKITFREKKNEHARNDVKTGAGWRHARMPA
jgi:hypothetical protein